MCYNIKMDIREAGLSVMDWIHLAEDRDQCEYDDETSGSIKFWEILK
jgi:hypothetical protein